MSRFLLIPRFLLTSHTGMLLCQNPNPPSAYVFFNFEFLCATSPYALNPTYQEKIFIHNLIFMFLNSARFLLNIL